MCCNLKNIVPTHRGQSCLKPTLFPKRDYQRFSNKKKGSFEKYAKTILYACGLNQNHGENYENIM